MCVSQYLDLCRKMAYAPNDYHIDRDDLFSAAMESFWIAEKKYPDDVLRMAKIIFHGMKTHLVRDADAKKRGKRLTYLSLNHEKSLGQVDKWAVDPMLLAMAIDEARVIHPGETIRCRKCGTRGGGRRRPTDVLPTRSKGLCRNCSEKELNSGMRGVFERNSGVSGS